MVRDGRVIYVGMSNDLYRRELEYRNDPRFEGARMQVLNRTNVYAEQRIIEHRSILQYGQDQPGGKPQYNINNGISPRNPLFNFYDSLD